VCGGILSRVALVYVSLDVFRGSGKVKKIEGAEKKEDKEHIGTPKENVRWIGTKEGQDS
jgi:hypothetical protein